MADSRPRDLEDEESALNGMAEILVTRAESGRTVSARVGDTIRVELEESPTTGYRWALSSGDARIVEPQGDSFMQPGGVAVGGSGTRVFRLAARSQGSVDLRFRLARQWESVAPRAEFSVRIAVG
jgi:inhibitor of cysteine peptidase